MLRAPTGPVTWAHAVDLPDPWRWVRAGDLVMTTGVGMPREAAEQAAWLARVAEAQVSAVVIAPAAAAPPITDELVGAADQRGLPVLGGRGRAGVRCTGQGGHRERPALAA
ncbi:MAG: PucR family transcriptional regulator ligand-binding domain-containing protein [Micrococcales bacterium]|nr:PucR family transcriptional regulator ligand-binding domain-containing protein [Micrococcales bacterium]